MAGAEVTVAGLVKLVPVMVTRLSKPVEVGVKDVTVNDKVETVCVAE